MRSRGLVAAFAACALMAGAGAAVAGPDDAPAQLLEFQPLSGNAAPYGKLSTPATDIAIAEINKAGGINGRQVQLLREDNQTNPRIAVQTLQRTLISAKAIGLTSMNSSTLIAIEPIAAQHHVTIINTAAQAEAVMGRSKWLISIIPGLKDETRAIVRFAIENRKYKRFAIVSPDDALGQSARQEFQQAVKDFGGTIVDDQVHPLGGRDYTAIVSHVKAAAPDALLIGDYGLDVPVLLNQLQAFGATIPLFGTSGFPVGETLNSPAAKGAHYIAATYNTTPELEKEYRERSGGQNLNLYAVNAYQAVYVFADLIKRVLDSGQPVTGEAINEAFWKDPTFKTPLGPLAFDQRGVVRRTFAVYEVTGPSQTAQVGSVD